MYPKFENAVMQRLGKATGRNTMNILLITYDLNKEGEDRPPIAKVIRKLGKSRVQLSESSYAIATSKSPSKLYQELKDMLDKNDRLFILTLSKPGMAYDPAKKVSQWLDDNLP